MSEKFIGEPSPEVFPPTETGEEKRLRNLALGLVFGMIFGFLLQKGGVAKYEILIGVLLLKDFTVVKVMLSAVIVGMLGISIMYRLGLVELHIKPTRLLSNALGGVVFGIGFALSAYCPGTGAAALGQGNYDALAVVAGLIVGSYLYAEASGWITRTIDRCGDRGDMTLDGLLHIKRQTLIPIMVILLIGIIILIHVFIDPTP